MFVTPSLMNKILPDSTRPWFIVKQSVKGALVPLCTRYLWVADSSWTLDGSWTDEGFGAALLAVTPLVGALLNIQLTPLFMVADPAGMITGNTTSFSTILRNSYSSSETALKEGIFTSSIVLVVQYWYNTRAVGQDDLKLAFTCLYMYVASGTVKWLMRQESKIYERTWTDSRYDAIIYPRNAARTKHIIYLLYIATLTSRVNR